MPTAVANTSVSEAGLPARPGEAAGSDSSADSEKTSGTITYTAADVPAVVTINGTAVTAVDQTFTNVSGPGTLTITSISAGSIGYSYTLTDNTSGDATHDDFAVVVTDKDGDHTDKTLVINIADDAPTARADTDSVAAGGYGPETGNVITGVGTTSGAAGADTQGADSAKISQVASDNVPANVDNTVSAGAFTVNGQYGVLTLNEDGGYSYVRNAGTPGGVNDVFTYTLKDGDTDTKTATLTIAIGDSTPGDTIPTAGGLTTTVYEAGLAARGSEPAGSNAAANTETVAGTVAFASPDGVSVVSLGGHALTGVDQTFSDGTTGSLTAHYTYSAATGAGSISYSYTLLDNTSGDNTTASFAVVVTDQDGDSAPAGNLVINIVDDVPTLGTFASGVMPNEIGTVNGSFSVTAGADGLAGFTITPPNNPLLAYSSTNNVVAGQLVSTTLTATANGTPAYSLEVKADGTYTFNLLDPDAHGPTDPISLVGLAPGGPVATVTTSEGAVFDGLAFTGTTTTSFTNPNNGGGSGGDYLNVSGNGFGLGSANAVEDNRGFMFHLTGTNSLTFWADLTSNTNTATISWAAYNGTGAPTSVSLADTSGSQPLSADGSVTINPTGSFDWLVVRVDVTDGNLSSGGIRFQDFSFTKTVFAQDNQLNFAVAATDQDGDITAASQLGVHIVGGAGAAYILPGTDATLNPADAIAASHAADTMTGGAGADVFQWSLNDIGPLSAVDHITDFAPGNGGDVLNLKDLLVGEHDGSGANSPNLSQFLQFSEVAGKAVLSIDHNGTSDGLTFVPDQKITFDNMSLTQLASALGSATTEDADIIAKMLIHGNLKTDV